MISNYGASCIVYSQEYTIYYVSPSGSDTNTGTMDQPWQTPSYGVSQLVTGDTLFLLPGEYQLDSAIHFEISGTEQSPITLTGQDAILNGAGLPSDFDNRDAIFVDHADNIIIENLVILNAPRSGLRISWSDHVSVTNSTFGNNGKWGIFSDFADYISIDSCETYGSGEEHGIYLSNSGDYPVVRNCLVHDNHASGIQFNADPLMGGDGIISGGIVENNYVYHNGEGGGAAINFASVRNTIVQNNLLFDNLAGGIACWDDGNDGTAYGCKDNTFANNLVIFEEGYGRSALQMIEGSTGNIAVNNILIAGDSGDYALELDTTSSVTSDYNIFYHLESEEIVWTGDDALSLNEWQDISFDTNSYSYAPSTLFVDYLGNDYHHVNDSSAIDVGTDSYAPTYDIEGTLRPYNGLFDIGPYEYSPFASTDIPYSPTTSPVSPSSHDFTNLYLGITLLGFLCVAVWWHYRR
ncbi:MAG: hypothetical protein BAJATHORv1_30396 [Candidatus Thorarchaeota archaeon]|nr:MAG: hypothetical protein BAJATHORv1_30396 [Candidatus Thorarchaeota archaeon]